MVIGNGQMYDDCFNVFQKIADKSVDMAIIKIIMTKEQKIKQ